MPNTDVAGYCLPDCNKCGKPALSDLGPAAYEACEFFVKFKWLTECRPKGDRRFGQYPDFACWYNCPLCLSMCFIPCCCNVVHLRNMEKMTSRSYESNCLICCVLSMCCCMNNCYYARHRGAFREKYGIQGSACCDCCCFGCCYICQDANELQERGGYEIPFCSAKIAGGIRGATGGNALTQKVAELNDKVSDKVTQKVQQTIHNRT